MRTDRPGRTPGWRRWRLRRARSWQRLRRSIWEALKAAGQHRGEHRYADRRGSRVPLEIPVSGCEACRNRAPAPRQERPGLLAALPYRSARAEDFGIGASTYSGPVACLASVSFGKSLSAQGSLADRLIRSVKTLVAGN